MSRWHPHRARANVPLFTECVSLYARRPASPSPRERVRQRRSRLQRRAAILATAAVASAIWSSKVEMEHKDAAIGGSSSSARELRLPPLQPSGFPEADRGCRLYNRSRMFLRARH